MQTVEFGAGCYSAQWGDKTSKNIFLIKTFNFLKLASEFGWTVTPRRNISVPGTYSLFYFSNTNFPTTCLFFYFDFIIETSKVDTLILTINSDYFPSPDGSRFEDYLYIHRAPLIVIDISSILLQLIKIFGFFKSGLKYQHTSFLRIVFLD